jgi:hypothetical protein
MAATAPGFQAGTNQSGGNYYIPVIWDNNWGPSCEVQQYGASNGAIQMPYDSIGGAAGDNPDYKISDIQTTSGSVFNSTDATVTIVSQNNSTGQLQLSITDGTGQLNRSLNWSGVKPTQFTVTRKGRTGRTPIEWINAVQGQWIRDLDATFQNPLPINGTAVHNTLGMAFYGNDVGTGAELPYQVKADAIAAKMATDPAFVGYWSVIPIDVIDADVTAKAIYERDTIPQRGKIALEFGNELIWNDFTGSERVMIDGVRKGWYGAATFAAPQPALIVYGEGGGPAGAGAGGLQTTAFCASGNYIDANVYGVGPALYRAKQDAPIGTYVTAGVPGSPVENAYFTKTTIDRSEAGRRWRSVRHDQIIEIYRTVFGETRFQAQIVPVVMGQTGGNLFDQLIVERTFVPGYWAKVKGMGNAGYYGPDQAYDTNTVTAAQLATSFIASYAARDAYVLEAVRAAAQAGKTPMIYEGLTHTNPGYGANGNEQTQWNLLFTQDAGRQIIYRIANFFRENLPGVWCAYDGIGRTQWSLMRYFRDTANPRLLGWKDGVGAVAQHDEGADIVSSIGGYQSTIAGFLDSILSSCGRRQK